MLNEDIYRGRVKLISEFMQRFNGEEKNPYIDHKAPASEKINLCQLFDTEFILKNRQVREPEAFKFIDSVLQNKVKIQFSDAEWYAKAKCVGSFKGKEVTFHIYLTVESRGKKMYKWVISDVEGEIFNLTPSRESDKIMLYPNEHESDFMRLNSITDEKDDYITLYSSKYQNPNRLTVFNTLVYYGYLNLDYVSDLEYCFLQVPGYIFTIKEFERESTNSGWLISEWSEISDEDKETILQRLYNGNYHNLLPNNNETSLSNTSLQNYKDNAIEKVGKFIDSLNGYINDKTLIKEINNAVKGRYTFIISDEICTQLSKHYKTKQQKSYRLATLLGWLSRSDSPIKSIEISNPILWENENVRPEYADGYTLVKCELSTKGDLQIYEQVVFFIYEDQIAGVKFITDCF